MRRSLLRAASRVGHARRGHRTCPVKRNARGCHRACHAACKPRKPRDSAGLDGEKSRVKLAPAVGLEPTTKRLTAARSTTELRRNARVAPTGPSGSGANYRRRAAGAPVKWRRAGSMARLEGAIRHYPRSLRAPSMVVRSRGDRLNLSRVRSGGRHGASVRGPARQSTG